MGMMINRRRVCGGGEKLPQGAVRIEYLESTGTQWIDTGLTTLPAYDNTQFEYTMEVMFLNSTGRELMGTDGYNFFGKNGTIPEVVSRTTNINIVGTWAEYTVITKRRELAKGKVNGYEITGGNRYYDASYPAYHICIFGIGKRITTTNSPSHLCTCKLKYFKIAEDSIVVFDAIPVRVGQTGYLYDKVSGQLFGNSGTGNFILGPDKGAVTQPIIDMGLPSGTLWAQGNIIKDANGNYAIGEPTDYGCYFSWGNIDGHNEGEGYNFNSDNYALTPGSQLTGDISSDDAEHDAAVARIGGGFHLPSGNQMMELFNSEYTTNEWTTLNGVNGRRVTSLINGNSIFFPAAGYYKEESLRIRGSNCSSWSSRRSGLEYAYRLSFSGGGVNPQNSTDKYLGLSVRAVLNV